MLNLKQIVEYIVIDLNHEGTNQELNYFPVMHVIGEKCIDI